MKPPSSEVDPAEDPELLFPAPRTCPFSPPEAYTRRRRERPLAPVRMLGGNEAWMVTRYEDVRSVLGHQHTSADRRAPGFPRFAPAGERLRRDSYFRTPLNWQDPPEHTRTRSALTAEFTMRRVSRLRPRIQEITDARVDRMLRSGGPLDLVRHLALPVPSTVICEILGVPYSEHARFEPDSALMMDRNTPAAERFRAAHTVRSYLGEVVAWKERCPGDDLLSRLLAEAETEGRPDPDGVTSTAFVLLVAGHITTSSMISLGTLALLEHPGQLALMTADPARVPGAVEELLRYCSIVEAATARTASADLDIAGTRIANGEGLVPVIQTANRDPEVFDRPDELDIGRRGRGHLSFGHGRHHCLGKNLARAELQIVLGTLFRRIPSLRAAVPLGEVAFRGESNIHGLRELPVTW
ncbi:MULTISPECIES: cytochrome P450 [Nocardiopsis]|uniref:Cytochrome n=1 Tax=Nocardiopsis sinuspersici TaxID=501010 RepID=A0A1V3C914_9ACTN|nr:MULTISPECIES: cytochrome P450 [Nocardiopsis]OOC57016.1 cytochrome [Nocardiopsis sinuspersici]